MKDYRIIVTVKNTMDNTITEYVMDRTEFSNYSMYHEDYEEIISADKVELL